MSNNDNGSKRGFQFEVGSHWEFFVPPGWLIGGTVIEDYDQDVALKDVAYLESNHPGKSNVGDVPMAKDAKEQLAASAQSYQMPDGTTFRKEALLIKIPSAISFKALARRQAADAIKKAR